MEKKSANSYQPGGSHYGLKEYQHWDRMWDLYREAWFVGNITKYVERYRKKDGIKDLIKVRHYLDKLIELEEAEAAEKLSENEYTATTDKTEWHFGYNGKCLCGADYPNISLTSDGVHVTCLNCKLLAMSSITQNNLLNLLNPNSNNTGIIQNGQNSLNEKLTEYCCECGEEYPRAELLAGEIYCQKCRKLESTKLRW